MIDPIRREDRISTVLKRDERLLEVLVAASPALAKLRNPVLRATMSKLATVEHAARVAGLDADDLLARLNGALEGRVVMPPRVVETVPTSASPRETPSFVNDTPQDKIVDLDVRDELRAGREPFGMIMAAVRAVEEGHVLRIRAIFEPAPLYSVLKKQGFSHYTEKFAEDDYRVWFLRGPKSHAPAAVTTAPNDASGEGPDVRIIDVRGLEPPEPMVRTLEALEELPRGMTLIQLNVRTPQFLLPQLTARGFVYEVREQSDELVRIFIRHDDSKGTP